MTEAREELKISETKALLSIQNNHSHFLKVKTDVKLDGITHKLEE